MNLKAKTVLFLATGAHIGNIPLAPGTFGSVEGLFFCYLLSRMPLPGAVIWAALFILFAIWVSHEAEKEIGKKDPGCVVIDEVAGMMITLIGLPFTVVSATMGFIVFRALDIFKPPPIRTIQDRLTGGAGIVLDDVAAGIIANVILRLVFAIAGIA